MENVEWQRLVMEQARCERLKVEVFRHFQPFQRTYPLTHVRHLDLVFSVLLRAMLDEAFCPRCRSWTGRGYGTTGLGTVVARPLH